MDLKNLNDFIALCIQKEIFIKEVRRKEKHLESLFQKPVEGDVNG